MRARGSPCQFSSSCIQIRHSGFIERKVSRPRLYGLMLPLNVLMISMRASRYFAREKSAMSSLKGEAMISQVVSKNESQLSMPPDPNDTFGIEDKPDCIVIA